MLLAVLYGMIFFFSAEDGTRSSAVSARVTKALVSGYCGLMGKGAETVAEMVMLLEGIVRKLAHFLEYMCVGLLSFSIVALWRGVSRRGALAVLLQVFISAALDELHQYFVPGRWASFTAVATRQFSGM